MKQSTDREATRKKMCVRASVFVCARSGQFEAYGSNVTFKSEDINADFNIRTRRQAKENRNNEETQLGRQRFSFSCSKKNPRCV